MEFNLSINCFPNHLGFITPCVVDLGWYHVHSKMILMIFQCCIIYPSFPIIYIYISMMSIMSNRFSIIFHPFSHHVPIDFPIDFPWWWNLVPSILNMSTLSRSIFWQRNAPWGSSRWSNSWPSWTCPRTATIPRGHIFAHDVTMWKPCHLIAGWWFQTWLMGKSPFLMGKSTINGSTLKRTSCQTLG